MEHLIVLLLYLSPVLLLVAGGLVGRSRENRHYASIHQREARFAQQPILNSKTVPAPETVRTSKMVAGSVVVSVDRFKQFLAALRTIFGGEVNAYSSLIDRARREAILRMREQAAGADMIINVRMETASLSQGDQKQMGTIEVLAYGTALWHRKDHEGSYAS